jgi:hypothetical protein
MWPAQRREGDADSRLMRQYRVARDLYHSAAGRAPALARELFQLPGTGYSSRGPRVRQPLPSYQPAPSSTRSRKSGIRRALLPGSDSRKFLYSLSHAFRYAIKSFAWSPHCVYYSPYKQGLPGRGGNASPYRQVWPGRQRFYTQFHSIINYSQMGGIHEKVLPVLAVLPSSRLRVRRVSPDLETDIVF